MDRLGSERGASVVEYAIVLFAVAAICAVAVAALGSVVNDSYAGACDRIAAKVRSSNC